MSIDYATPEEWDEASRRVQFNQGEKVDYQNPYTNIEETGEYSKGFDVDSKAVDPDHYKTEDPAYEHQRVVAAWKLDYWVAASTKYSKRAGEKIEPGKTKKEMMIKDYKKAIRYLEMKIELLEEGVLQP